MTTSASSNSGIWSYTGTGAQTSFGYDNKIFVDSDLEVYVDGVLKTLTTDYTVTGAGTADGGNVVFVTAPAADTEVVLFRRVGDAQESDYVDGDQFPADVVEDDFDRQAILNQDNKRDIQRSLRLADFDAETTIGAIPAKADRLGKALTFNATTGAPEVTSFVNLPGDAVLSDDTPSAPSAAGSAGVSGNVSRGDHVHPRPSAADIGAMANLVEDTTPQLGGALDPNGKFIGWDKGEDIASASPLVIGTDGNYFDVTGTTGFSAMTVAANRLFMLQFDGILTMTHGASLNLPGGADITTAAGDECICMSTAADTVRVISYAKADGTPVIGGGGDWGDAIATDTASTSSEIAFSGFEAGYDYLFVIDGIYPATDGQLMEAELAVAGPTYRQANYDGSVMGLTSSAETPQAPTDAIAMHANGGSNVSTEVGNFSLLLLNPAAATKTAWRTWGFYERSDSVLEYAMGGGQHTTAEAMTGVRFKYTGNIAAGNFSAYRRKRT